MNDWHLTIVYGRLKNENNSEDGLDDDNNERRIGVTANHVKINSSKCILVHLGWIATKKTQMKMHSLTKARRIVIFPLNVHISHKKKIDVNRTYFVCIGFYHFECYFKCKSEKTTTMKKKLKTSQKYGLRRHYCAMDNLLLTTFVLNSTPKVLHTIFMRV